MTLRFHPGHKYFRHGSTVITSRTLPCSNLPIRNLQIIPPLHLEYIFITDVICKQLSMWNTFLLHHLRFAQLLKKFLAFCETWRFNTVFTKKINSVGLFRKRTIPTERPPLVGEVSANFSGRGCWVVSAKNSHGCLSRFSRPEPLIFHSSSPSIVLTRLIETSGTVARNSDH
jgi:hypothetical protein